MKTFSFIVLFSIVFFAFHCKSSKDKKEISGTDNRKKDSVVFLNSPNKTATGTEVFKREMENLGKLDSLVTPQQPTTQNP